MKPFARELATLSAREMVAALGAARAPSVVQRGLAWPFFLASRALGEALADVDDAILRAGLPAAARLALKRFGVESNNTGTAVALGPCLILANHPGAYDAFALMAAIDRDDLLILAADRGFLRALPRLSAHLLFVGADAGERARSLKRALSHLARGGALLHFPAGEIEPDASFETDRAKLLKPWQPGAAALVQACARRQGRVLVAGVRGVHSARAKRLLVNRLAERRGVTTLSALLQIVLRLRDVHSRVALLEPESAAELLRLDSAEQISRLRAALLRALCA
jgi:1-acyl-sn-glycerol-3-phosphate acyltransferase